MCEIVWDQHLRGVLVHGWVGRRRCHCKLLLEPKFNPTSFPRSSLDVKLTCSTTSVGTFHWITWQVSTSMSSSLLHLSVIFGKY